MTRAIERPCMTELRAKVKTDEHALDVRSEGDSGSNAGCSRRRRGERKRIYGTKGAADKGIASIEDACDEGAFEHKGCDDESHAGGISFASAKEDGMRTGTRHDRVRDLGGSLGSDRHHSHNDIPPQIARALGCDSARDIRSVACVVPGAGDGAKGCGGVGEDNIRPTDAARSMLGDLGERIGHFVPLRDLLSECISKFEVESGQGTVEYALVLTACLSIFVALGLLMGSIEDGVFVDHAVQAASHNVEVLLGGAADVFSY